MVITTLDDRLISSGEQLLRQLDRDKLLVDAALWFYFADTQSWKLVLSLPQLIPRGPKAAYKTVQDSLAQTRGLSFSLEDVVVATPDSPIVKLLRLAITTGPGISGIRFTNNVINGELIPDAYIYRLMPYGQSTPLKSGSLPASTHKNR